MTSCEKNTPPRRKSRTGAGLGEGLWVLPICGVTDGVRETVWTVALRRNPRVVDAVRVEMMQEARVAFEV